MADLPVKTAKLLLDNVLRHLRESGTILAQADAPVFVPKLAKLSTEIDDIDIEP
jgi:hypothetical protein